MYCHQCKNLIPDVSNFCLYCGSQVIPANTALEAPSAIEITRLNIFAGSAFAFNIFIDDQDVMRLGNGKTAKVEVMSGKHSVLVKFGRLSTTFELSLVPSETVKLVCGVSQGFFESKLFVARILVTKGNT